MTEKKYDAPIRKSNQLRTWRIASDEPAQRRPDVFVGIQRDISRRMFGHSRLQRMRIVVALAISIPVRSTMRPPSRNCCLKCFRNCAAFGSARHSCANRAW